MDDRVQLFLQQTGPVLCIDIGAYLQNAIFARPGMDCENWPRFTFFSPAQIVAQRIRELTLLKRGLWLYGKEMGGSFRNALREHLGAGLHASATREAARSIHDNEDVLKDMGVLLTETCPQNCIPIYLGDYDPGFWSQVLRSASLPQPHIILAAAQDHGTIQADNTHGRIRYWQKLLLEQRNPCAWVYEHAPDNFNRLKSLQSRTGGPVADTATCAILGGLIEQSIFERSCREGITIINVGNTHTIAALVYKGDVYGIYEHHTDKRDLELLLEDLKQFRLHWLPAEHVQSSGGHGTAYADDGGQGGSFSPTYILGPRRSMLAGTGTFIAPHGDMAHAGCFGLLYGWARQHAKVQSGA